MTAAPSVSGALAERAKSRIDGLRADIRDDYQRLGDRMRTVEQGFAKIDQRLATLERVVIPGAGPAD